MKLTLSIDIFKETSFMKWKLVGTTQKCLYSMLISFNITWNIGIKRYVLYSYKWDFCQLESIALFPVFRMHH